MQSLRSRRPSESRPVKRNASKLAKAPSTRQNVRKSTVDDKMKKRMSLRYAEISSPTGASLPAVPTIPLGLRPGAPRDPDEIVLDVAQVKEDPRALDQRLLDRVDFDPNGCELPTSPNSPLTTRIARPQNKTRQLDRGRAQVPPVLSPLSQGRHRRRAPTKRLQKVGTTSSPPLTTLNDVAMPNSFSSRKRSASSRTRCSNSRKVSRNGKACPPSCILTSPPPSQVCLPLPPLSHV